MTQFTRIFTIIPFPLRALRTDPRGPAPCRPSETAEDVEQLHGQAPAAARPREHRAAGARGADGRTSADDCCILYNIYIYSDDIYWLLVYIYIHIYIWPYINMYNVLYVSSSPPSLFSCSYDFMWYFYGAGGQFQPGDPLPNHSYSCSWSRKVIAFHGNLGRFDPAEIAEIVEIVGPLVTSKGGNRWNMQELLVRIPTSSHRWTALFLASIHRSIDPSWPWHQWWSMVAMNP